MAGDRVQFGTKVKSALRCAFCGAEVKSNKPHICEVNNEQEEKSETRRFHQNARSARIRTDGR